jgi:SynChlorMet cassette protein ScmD
VLYRGERPIANPLVMLREEFDDWAVLFNPDVPIGFGGFGLNPTGVCLWKLLDGERTLDELLDEVRRFHEGVPEEARDHIGAFVDALVREGLAACGDRWSCREKNSHVPLGPLNEVKPFTYEPPKLINLSSGQSALGVCASHGSAGGDCYTGAGATGCCSSGGCGTPYGGVCCGGTCGGITCGSGTGACDSFCTNGTGNNGNCGFGSGPNYQCLDGSATGNGQCRCGSGGSCTNGFSYTC